MVIVPCRLMRAHASSQGFYEDKMKCHEEAFLYSFHNIYQHLLRGVGTGAEEMLKDV